MQRTMKPISKWASILGWIFGVFFAFGGIAYISDGTFVSGIASFTISGLLIPPVREKIYGLTGIDIPTWARGLSIFALLLIVSSSNESNKTQPASVVKPVIDSSSEIKKSRKERSSSTTKSLPKVSEDRRDDTTIVKINTMMKLLEADIDQIQSQMAIIEAQYEVDRNPCSLIKILKELDRIKDLYDSTIVKMKALKLDARTEGIKAMIDLSTILLENRQKEFSEKIAKLIINSDPQKLALLLQICSE